MRHVGSFLLVAAVVPLFLGGFAVADGHILAGVSFMWLFCVALLFAVIADRLAES